MRRLTDMFGYNNGAKGGRRHRRKVVMTLAVLVVFVTTYSLILPAITLDEQHAEATPGIETGEPAEVPAESTAADQNETASPVAEPKGESQPAGSSESESAQPAGSSESTEESGESSVSEEADMPAEEEQLPDEEESEEEPAKAGELAYEGSDYKVTVRYSADAAVPEGAELDCFIRSAEEADRISEAHAFYNSLTAEEKSDFIVVDGRTYVRKIWERNHPDGK